MIVPKHGPSSRNQLGGGTGRHDNGPAQGRCAGRRAPTVGDLAEIHDAQVCFRIDGRFKARIQDLVNEGEYRNISDFMIQAVLDTFAFDRITVEGQYVPRVDLTEFFSTDAGRTVLVEAMRVGLSL
jgi:hypothetical protein